MANSLNINAFNRMLFILEAVLLTGVLSEYLQGIILQYDFGFYLNVLFIMVTIGIIFTFAFNMIEPLMRSMLSILVRINRRASVRIIVHLLIFALIYLLYAKVYFGMSL